jgi:CDP-diacylglycerol--glycerol-3-phosphate 3-phosphatidyltransferase
LNLPNLLTMGRILVIPLVLYLLDRGGPFDCYLAALVFVLAAITDFLDGYLARKRNLVSVLGKFLDPLADKLIVTATLVWLVTMGRVPAWLVIILIGREITITALRGIATTEGLVIAAGEGGKSKTALQMVGLVCLILGYPYHVNLYVVDFGVVDLVMVGRALIYGSLVFSIVSAFQYGKFFVDAVEAKAKRARAA